MPATFYPAIIDRSASGFGVTFPDFPGCIANGDSANEAALNAEAALALHVEAMVKDKNELPAPSALDSIEEIEGADDVARLLVRVDTPAKVERVLISLDTGLLRAIDAVASNRSAWIADAARAALVSGKDHAATHRAPRPSKPADGSNLERSVRSSADGRYLTVTKDEGGRRGRKSAA